MSSYTISIRNIINMLGRDEVESWFKDYNLEDYLTPKQIQTINETGLWNKDKLAKKIVDHFFMHEIGFETIELFKRYAKSTMQEIMEEKLPIIYSNALQYDPLVNVDFTETFVREIEGESNYGSNSTLRSTLQNNGSASSSSNSSTSGTSNSSSDSTNESLNIINKTPQTRITKQNLDTGAYAHQVDQDSTSQEVENETTSQTTNISTGQTSSQDTQTNNSSQEAESSQDSNTKETYTRKQKGNSGSLTTAQALVMQYRQSIYAVDKEIIQELNCLFMGLF